MINNIKTFFLGFSITAITSDAMQNLALALFLAFAGGFLSLLGRMACTWLIEAVKQKTFHPSIKKK